MIDLAGEEEVAKHLSQFKCSKNGDVERFLIETAIPQEKGSKSRTYLIVNEDSNQKGIPDILAYFTLAIHIMIVSPKVSKSMAKKLAMFYDEDAEIQRTPCFIIGEIGKNDLYGNNINGDEIIRYAIDAINIAHVQIGGKFIKIDCEPVTKLMEYYTRNGFQFVQYDEKDNLNELVMFF